MILIQGEDLDSGLWFKDCLSFTIERHIFNFYIKTYLPLTGGKLICYN